MSLGVWGFVDRQTKTIKTGRNLLLIKIASDDYNARGSILIRPFVQYLWRVEHVLNSVDDHW